MSETKDKEKTGEDDGQQKKTLSLSGKTLSLKGAAGTQSRANVTPGRGGGSSVAVEVRRKRLTPAEEEAQKQEEARHLTDGEKEARARALQAAQSDTGARKTRLPRRQTTLNDKLAEEKTAEAQSDARSKELEELQRIESEEKVKPDQNREAIHKKEYPPHGRGQDDGDNAGDSYRDRLKKAATKAPAKPRVDNSKYSRRITVTQALNNDHERDRGPSLAAQRRAREKARLAASQAEPPKKVMREVTIPETITVQELANRMTEPGAEVIKILMKMGVMVTITQVIDADTAELVVSEMGHTVRRVTDADVEIGIEGIEDKEEDMQSRPPVVTIMGHVDHGKTSLLDALRATDVVSGEAGGITQHIGAYQVTMPGGAKITFLDTPGHAAFTEMRARGANVTDIVIIVVAANDSVMPQTIEAIAHAKAAKVPMIIAINKVDLPDANPGKIKQDLLQHEVVVEEMGGDTLCVEISAKQKKNLDKLEEIILLQAEVLELKANPKRPAQGVIVESKLERGRGPVATVLIQRGTLKVGDVFVAGAEFGKVRALINDHGKNVDTAIPGQPVEVLGLNAAPDAGDPLAVVPDESRAREISSYRQRKRREAQAAIAVKGRTTIEQLIEQREAGEVTKLPVVIRADVHGSIEAIIGSFVKMAEANPSIEVQVLHSGVGGITESDVILAKASGGLIIGFNVRAGAQAREMAQRDGVDIRYYNVIYNVIDDAKAILTGMLAPTLREEYLGQAEILKVFNITKVGKVAGCMIKDGNVKRGAKVRLLRDDVVIHEGTLKTLKRHQDEVKEVKEGMECGMAFESYDDIKAGDIIECYEVISEARTVE